MLLGMNNSDLLTPEETAAALRLSMSTVYSLIHSGKIPAVRLGIQWRIPASSIATLKKPVEEAKYDAQV